MVLVLTAATASAQSAFVQGTFGADIKRFSGEAGTSVFDGTAQLFAIGAGGHSRRTGRCSPNSTSSGSSSQTTTTTVAISGQPRDIHNTYTSERRGLRLSSATRRRRIMACSSRTTAVSVSAPSAARSRQTPRRSCCKQPAPTSDYTDRLTGPDRRDRCRDSPRSAPVAGTLAAGAGAATRRRSWRAQHPTEHRRARVVLRRRSRTMIRLRSLAAGPGGVHRRAVLLVPLQGRCARVP